MKLRTEIKPLDLKGKISHKDRIFLIGSCFTDTIGSRLRNALFDICSNPFGTVYNPASINLQLERIKTMDEFSGDDLVRNNGMFHSFMAHSSLSSVSESKALDSLNDAMHNANTFLRSADIAIVTLGSSTVYSLESTGEIVANCHKFPAGTFKRSMLSLEDVTSDIESIRSQLKALHPDIFIIFTISPIRYVSDGLHCNQLSKARLLLGVEDICNRHEDDCIYFPSYEILLDDLRDYRFYESDMKHPSETAADYVFEIFCQSFFSDKTIDLALQASKLSRRMAHRQLTDNKESYLTFKTSTNELIRQFADKYPEVAETIYKRFQL